MNPDAPAVLPPTPTNFKSRSFFNPKPGLLDSSSPSHANAKSLNLFDPPDNRIGAAEIAPFTPIPIRFVVTLIPS
jgi:hypothetical protein